MSVLGPNEILIEDRYRQDLGDVDALAQSIRQVGLLHPVVVTEDHRLIAGERRLAALQRLGWKEIPVRVAGSLGSAADLLRAERDENTCRKDLTASEVAALGARLEEYYEPKAKEAMTHSPGRPTHDTEKVGSGEPTFSQDEDSRTRAQVGKALGVSGRR